MDAKCLERLAERVGDLERQNRLLKRIGVLLMMGSAVLIVVGTGLVKAPRQVEAQQFIVRDESGRVRARLAANRDGTPSLVLLDDQGRELVGLRTLPDRTSMLNFSSQNELRMALTSGSDGSAALNIFGRKHRGGGLALWVDSMGTATLARNGRRLDLGMGPTRLAAERATLPMIPLAPTAFQVNLHGWHGRRRASPILGGRADASRAVLTP